MAVREILPTLPAMMVDDAESVRRWRRWRFFQAALPLLYAGIVLDVLTTAIAIARTGPSYEQNPFAGALLQTAGWPGMVMLVTLVCLVCYVSFRVVYFRLSPTWALILNVVVVLLAAARWLVVAAAFAYLAG
ncbi:MAG: hypothetical protein ACRDFS_01345 [Chloroflexota bacterium]